MADQSITDLAHERGEGGELLPVEKTVEVRGEGEARVDVYPATSGQRREWRRRLDDQDDELDDETQADLFDTFLTYEPGDFGGAESWDDIRPSLEDALANAIFAELFDVEEDDFSEALEGAMAEIEGNPNLMEG